ncbi:hypothetical protein NQZ68_029786 [Dissostichus eleginoides]|nr:hypothetical protein NQZ68_029786 [Dissostichus eleginoides]
MAAEYPHKLDFTNRMLNLPLDLSETQNVCKGYLNHIDIECHRDIIHQNNIELLHLREKPDKNNQTRTTRRTD